MVTWCRLTIYDDHKCYVTLEQSVARLGRLVTTRWLITQGRSLQQQGNDVHLSNLLKAGTIHKAKDITLGREEEESD